MENISSELARHLPEGLLHLLREVGVAAQARSEKAYLVGGAVRDVVLGRPNYDLDLVVEGEAISLAGQLAKSKDWAVRGHPRFGTAKLLWDDFSLDLVTARSETYERPGALPTVRPGSIDDDLLRRDFAMNAMAVRLNADSFGELLDPHDGRGDLAKNLVRVLHGRSFADDPTRMLRAIRYEQRLDFRLESETETQLLRHVSSLDTVTGERLWHELDLILREAEPEKALGRAASLGILERMYSAFTVDQWLVKRFQTVRERTADGPLSRPEIHLGLLAFRLSSEESEGCISRFRMPGWAKRTMRAVERIRESIGFLRVPDLQPSQIYRKLTRYTPEVVAVAAVASDVPLVRERLALYLRRLRHVRPMVDGDDLQAIGVRPGREMGQILKQLHDAKLDQRIETREEELSLARILASERSM